MGLGICYDIRFAELAQIYAQKGEVAHSLVGSWRFESELVFVGRGNPLKNWMRGHNLSIPISILRLVLCMDSMIFQRL